MTKSPYDWLPDRHLGAAAALAHADEIIGQLSDVLFPYQTTPDGVIGLRSEVVGDVVQTVVESVVAIPRKVPLLVADALVVLRNALEHALFAEIEFLDGRLIEAAAKRVEIPAVTSRKDFDDWVKGRGKNAPASLRAGSTLVDRIELLQPYHDQSAPEQHPLARLVLHTNHAKHREPAVTAVRIAAMYDDENRPNSIDALPSLPEEPTRVGEVLGETPVGTQVPMTMFPTIGINRPGTDRWPVLFIELDEIFEWVRSDALPRLITGGQPPQPPLPAHYEISSGHDDERVEIAKGVGTSAAARHAQRLVAATARIDLAENISDLVGGLSTSDLMRWLDHLADHEVIERVDRLGERTHLPPDVRERYILRQLTKFRDEALAFMAGGA